MAQAERARAERSEAQVEAGKVRDAARELEREVARVRDEAEARMRADGRGAHIVERQAKNFMFWTPPYEFYPQGNSASGVPLKDPWRRSCQRRLPSS